MGTPAVGAMKLKIISVVLQNLLSQKRKEKKVYLMLFKNVEDAEGGRWVKKWEISSYFSLNYRL